MKDKLVSKRQQILTHVNNILGQAASKFNTFITFYLTDNNYIKFCPLKIL